MNMENCDNAIYLLSAALCSFLSLNDLQDVIGDLVRLSCSFNFVNYTLTFHLRYHETHDTKQNSSESSILHSQVVDGPFSHFRVFH